jgi:hypothetical protein
MESQQMIYIEQFKKKNHAIDEIMWEKYGTVGQATAVNIIPRMC